MNIKHKIASLSLVISLIIILVSSIVAPSSGLAEGDKDKSHKFPTVVGRESQVDKHTRVKLIKKNYDKGKLQSSTYEAVISSLPSITDDGQVIDTRWYEKKDSAGYTYYESGNNLFVALVTPGGRLSTQDSNGRLTAYQPLISVGQNVLTTGKPIILPSDPINGYYSNNILQWTYTVKTGIFGLNKETIKRQLRLIEGTLLESFIFSGHPGGDFIVERDIKNDPGAEGKLSGAIAFDSSKNPQYLSVNNRVDGFTISSNDFYGRTYPVIVDPSSTFTTSSYDGWLQQADSVWATARDAASGNAFSSSSEMSLIAGARLVGTTYIMLRTGLFFDSSAIPDDATPTSAYISLYNIFVSGAGSVIVQSGAPTYPHSPMVLADYNRTYYFGDGGSIALNTISGYNYYNINLSSTGLSWISKNGTTKFMLRHSNDVNNIVSTADDYWQFGAYEFGTGWAPKLVVTYTVPVVPPTVSTTSAYNVAETSLTFKGYLSNDGGEGCIVKFQYGPTSAYGSTTSSVSGVTSGSYFNIDATGLTRGTLYHFRAVATNTAGTTYGLDLTAQTLPAVPTAFTATADSSKNTLSWTKGTGATNTLVRSKTTGYPSSISDGTQEYFAAGAGFDDNGLTPGTTYYYSAWSETSGKYSTTYATAYAKPYLIGASTVETRAATEVGVATATLQGYLTALNQIGGTVAVTFQYYFGAGAWADNETAPPENMAAVGAFSKGIAGLAAATLYHVRAKAVGTNGTGYGADMPFTTGAISAPTMTTTAATGIGLIYATLNGKVTADGGAVVDAWFKWGLSADNLDGTTTASGPILYTDNEYFFNKTGLTPNTTYYFQAVGQNSAGIGYGAVLNFTTSAPSAPAVTTNDASSVGANEATLRGTLTSDGGVECEVQFEWDDDAPGAPYANSSGWQSGKRANDVFEAFLPGLTIGVTYYYRTSAKNGNSTVYGAEKTFTTVFLAPTNFTAKSVGATTVSLAWTKQGDQTYIVYKTTGYPVDRLDGSQVYFGSSSSCTHDGLSPGVTYFYRAWSWRTGDVWTGSYAEDAATTLPVKSTEEETTPGIQPAPSQPGGMYQEPSTSNLENIPGHEMIDAAADELGMPRGMFWLMCSMGALLSLGLMIYVPTGSALLAVIVVGIGMLLLAGMGIMPMWMLFVFVILALGATKVFGLGGNQ